MFRLSVIYFFLGLTTPSVKWSEFGIFNSSTKYSPFFIYRLLRHIVVLCIVGFFSIFNVVYAGSEQLFGTWGNVFINGQFAKDSNWIYYMDVSIRSSQTHQNSNGGQGYVFASAVTHDAIGYQFDQMNSVLVGYAFQVSEPPYAGTDTYENRTWQQYLNVYKTQSLGVFQNRSRFEQRTITSSLSGTALRWRQQLKWVYPVSPDWSFVASDEFFANMNTVSWGPAAGFNQNRLFVGAGYRFDKTYRTEFGYMNQYVNRGLVDDLIGHLLSLNLYIDI